MNESKLKTYCLEHAGEQLPPEAEALLQRDPELKQQVDRLVLVQKLVSLKRYEQPHPSCTLRCMRAVTARIEQRQQSPWLVAKARDWFSFEQPISGMAYGVAALAVCVIGAGLVLRSGSLNSDDMAGVDESPFTQTVTFAQTEQEELIVPVALITDDEVDVIASNDSEMIAATTAESISASDKPLIILRVGSDHQPERGRLSFGGEASMPVSFEY